MLKFRNLIALSCVLSLMLFFSASSRAQHDSDSSDVSLKYRELKHNNNSIPPYDLFLKGMNGFYTFVKDSSINKNILTLIDFRLESTCRRLWVIDIDNSEILYNTFVAHGKNTGGNKAKKFSNVPRSYMSSLGFYITAGTYYGKHGLSLNLDGQEKGFNKTARKRRIVMHGAKYVSKNFIRKYGRLGRSYGCPALPLKYYKQIIQTIKNKSCLFIFYPDPKYLKNSTI